MEERIWDMRDVRKVPTIAIRRKHSHLQTGTFQNPTERFQFVQGAVGPRNWVLK